MRTLLLLAGALGTALSIATAGAAPVGDTADDPSAAPPTPLYPNSAAEAAVFAAAAGGVQTRIDFESAPVGAFTNLAVAPGVTINGTDFNGNPQQILNAPVPGCGNLCGFNTTPGGSNYVQLFGGSLIFSFATAIDAFGAYFTGVQLDGETLQFSDGSSQSLTLPNPGSGVEFFGFTDLGRSIVSIVVNVQLPSGLGDIIGIDDVILATPGVGVPEPATLALLGAGLAGLGLIRTRRRRA